MSGYTGYSNTTNDALNALESKHDAEVLQLQTDLQTEVSNRTSADALLQSNIDAEAQSRHTADMELQGSIQDEATARQDADTALQSNIDAEAQARQSADQVLQSNIDTAVSNASADLQTEATARQSADDALSTRLSSVESWKQDHATAIHDAVNQAIADNTTLIGAVEQQLNTADSALVQGINAHIADRVATDEDHKAKLAVSSANDVAIQSVLVELRQYLEAFSQTYTIYDAQGNSVSPPDWSAMSSNIQSIVAHTASDTQTTANVSV